MSGLVCAYHSNAGNARGMGIVVMLVSGKIGDSTAFELGIVSRMGAVKCWCASEAVMGIVGTLTCASLFVRGHHMASLSNESTFCPASSRSAMVR